LALVLALVLAPVSQTRAAAVEVDRPTDAAGPAGRILVMLRMPPQHFRPNSNYGGSYGDGEGRSARWNAARRIAHQQGVSVVDEWPMPLLGVDCFVMVVPAGESTEAAAARLARAPGVSWSEPMHIYRGQGEPPTHNDPLYRVQPAAREWRLAELHQISTGRNVRVAIIDSMIEERHPDLAGQVELMENFVSDRSSAPEDHGTGVAGIIAARADNGLGVAGVAPQARLMGLRACWQELPRSGATTGGAPTVCDSLSLAKALEFAIDHKAQVVNMSLSGPSDLLLGRLVDVALARDMAVVAAYDRNLPEGGFPASHRGVVAVIDESSDPPIPGVFAAPGRDVPTTEPGGQWRLVNGSSFAAAHVSGLFALMKQRAPLLHSASALVVSRPGVTIDACATLLQNTGPCNCSCVRSHDLVASDAK
jgi:subtilisin family serine protease